MKKDKKHFRGALLEGLAEIAVTLIFFGIGALVIGLFGVKLDSPNIDGDFMILIGIVALCVIVAVVCVLLKWVKKLIDCAHRKGEKPMHHMKLHPAPFEMIGSGQKTIELRLYDEKRRAIKVGDQIVFTNTKSGEMLSATVLQLHLFDSFAELYQSLPLLKCGYTPDDVDKATPADMEVYYSIEEQKRYCVVGIELSVAE